ncbi:MAG: DNA polymerase I [Ruminococcaceae bacterium]|nr:DNA polymerase I [Oscillospiraceae bacterium]
MKKFLAVDGNSIVNRAFYGVRPLSNKEGFPTNALFGMVSILEKNIEAVKPDYCAIAFDLKAPTFRHKMYDAYKAGRRPTPEDLLRQMPVAKELAAALGFTCLEMEGYEADDILGTVATFAPSEECEVFVLTGDRDALQLISDRVHVLLVTNTETVDFSAAHFFEKYGVDASQFIDVKALMGDSSDNIPGVPGIGEKTALKLIADYGSLDGVYEALPTASLTPSVRRKLEEGKDSAYLSQKLATIYRAVPIDRMLDTYAYQGFAHAALLKLFTKLEFHAFIKRFGLGEAAPAPSAVQNDLPVPVLGVAEMKDFGKTVALDVLDGAVFVCNGTVLARIEDKAMLEAMLADTETEFVCHDAKSVYHALTALGIRWRGCHFDTMLAAYVLNAAENGFDLPRLALQYLGEQASAAPQHLFTILSLKAELAKRIAEQNAEKLLFEIEMPLCQVLTDMEQVGFAVDAKGLAAYGAQLSEVAEQLAARIYFAAGEEFNINSPKQLGEVLFEKLQLPHGKKTKTGYSTNAEVLEKLRHVHPIIEDILDYRQVTKLNSTYAEGLLKQMEGDGRIHTTFKQTGTATGRLSSAEPNLQNIPIRTELGRELRRYFIAKNNNYILIDADYSQIELRLLASMANDQAMIEAFNSGADIHASTAAKVFRLPEAAVTPELRKRAKAVNFGILYGMGAHSLSEDLHISMAQAREYIASYFAAYPDIDAYLKNVIAEAREAGYVTTLLGRRRYIPELSATNKMLQHFGERVAMNSPIQGTAADIIKIAMLRTDARLKREGIDARLVLQVHDELIIEAHRDATEKAEQILVEEMEGAVKLAVALSVGVAKGATWYDSH